MPTDLTRYLLFGIAAIVMGWFALGMVWNIRRGNAVLKWMQRGLPRLGEKTNTFLPREASQKAVAAEKVVLPRPPLPPNIT